jgi:hypothetical protein
MRSRDFCQGNSFPISNPGHPASSAAVRSRAAPTIRSEQPFADTSAVVIGLDARKSFDCHSSAALIRLGDNRATRPSVNIPVSTGLVVHTAGRGSRNWHSAYGKTGSQRRASAAPGLPVQARSKGTATLPVRCASWHSCQAVLRMFPFLSVSIHPRYCWSALRLPLEIPEHLSK